MGKIIDLDERRKKKIEREKKAEYNQTIRNILKLTEHLTIKNPKEGSDDQEKNPRFHG